jgi:hypothetical protein
MVTAAAREIRDGPITKNLIRFSCSMRGEELVDRRDFPQAHSRALSNALKNRASVTSLAIRPVGVRARYSSDEGAINPCIECGHQHCILTASVEKAPQRSPTRVTDTGFDTLDRRLWRPRYRGQSALGGPATPTRALQQASSVHGSTIARMQSMDCDG